MSVNSREMSEWDSRIESAWSASTASTGMKPASSTMSTARIRRTISSSTTRTFGKDLGWPDDMVDNFLCDARFESGLAQMDQRLRDVAGRAGPADRLGVTNVARAKGRSASQ